MVAEATPEQVLRAGPASATAAGLTVTTTESRLRQVGPEATVSV